jgi:hypothetical protein
MDLRLFSPPNNFGYGRTVTDTMSVSAEIVLSNTKKGN